MTLVIQVFVYPNAFDTHGVWAVCFLYLMNTALGDRARPLRGATPSAAIAVGMKSPTGAKKPEREDAGTNGTTPL